MVTRSRTLFACVLGVLAVAILLASATVALAAPVEPTLGLTALQAKLDAAPGGTIPGYLKTVCQGATIETIPVDVLAICGGATSDDSLILFEAKGPRIDKYGGIVSGMSGSPIYVDDGGTPKVIGALSYGDDFTLGGTGLATPIESMLKLTTDNAPRIMSLSKPVTAAGRVIDRVVVTSNLPAMKWASASGAFVAKPLSSVYIGGLRPNTKAYAAIAADMAKRGVGVVPLAAALSGASDPSFSTDLVGGASVAAMASRGQLWAGMVGTVTYATPDAVLAFGHPALWTGDSGMFMTNAWVDGVWPSQVAPYKIAHPTALRGVITQDRHAGIVGSTATMPAETPVRAHVVDADSGREATSAAYLSRSMLDSGQLGSMVGGAESIAGYQLLDASGTPGSAVTTTTVHLLNAGTPYTVTIRDFVDDSNDVVYASSMDAMGIVMSLTSVTRDGVESPEIVSVDLEASLTRHRSAASIESVNVYEPLHEGDNRVKVSMLAYGLAARQTVDATITIPEGTPLTGTLTATSGGWSDSGDGDPGASVPDRPTVAQIVQDLNGSLPMNELTVVFTPSDSSDGDVPPIGLARAKAAAAADTIEAHVPTQWALSGEAEAETADIRAVAVPATLAYGGSTMILGEIAGPSTDTTVEVYGTSADGMDERLLATDVAVSDGGGVYFGVPLSGLTTNMMLRIHCDATDGYLPADTYLDLGVRARVVFGASTRSVARGKAVLLTALVASKECAGTNVVFEYYNSARRVWRAITTRTLAAGTPYAKATASWKPTKGTWKVRVRYVGGPTNVASTSSVITIVAR